MRAFESARRRGDTALGAWVKLPGGESTEILADAGFDFAVVDMEHTLLDTTAVERHLVLGRALGLAMYVRVPDATPSLIQRVLDGGAAGVFVPHVDSAEDARRAAASGSFPPHGSRGSGGTSRAGDFGARHRAAYLAGVGSTVAQIESVAAVEALNAIASTTGLSAIMLGPADLGLDPRRKDLGAINEVSTSLVTAARGADIAAGTACAASDVDAKRELGFDFLVCASDVGLLSSAARNVIRTLTTREDPTHA